MRKRTIPDELWERAFTLLEAWDRRRDRKRIEPFLEEFRTLWLRFPEQRFGQLVLNLTRDDGVMQDSFNWEEDEWLRRIRDYRGT